MSEAVFDIDRDKKDFIFKNWDSVMLLLVFLLFHLLIIIILHLIITPVD